ncbi:MAG TPA: DUF5985 family protein [Myxococcota bacterium]|nr:DUF5985 family protein [Myxococcota bacterium]
MIVNVLGSLTVLLCAGLLLRGYLRTRQRLLLWSGLCFVGLTFSNLLLIVDLTVVPHIDLYSLRLGIGAASMLLLQYGLVFESD